MAELVLYTNPMSRGRIARWMLEETGQPYRAEILAYGDAMQGPAFRAINPMAKVPALVHGDAVVTECAAICAYLADSFPDAGLAPPAGSPQRGAWYRWLFFGAGPVEAAVTDASMGVHPEGAKLQGRVGYGSLPRVLDALEGLLADGRPWLLGPEFSAVDVYLGAHIQFGVQFGTIEPRPGFEDYIARITARPAAIRARQIDDALIDQAGIPPAMMPSEEP